ncbi:hypothetical protein [Caloramator sp. Dgby_cultured_2]|uniref:hypothetical protein n=1 Tax=Caloramator sp. Dgby_cultured_2 TaxID=3029174 RepID=UPI00237EE849|nr:hypothetical protein [Caloramator sp. Dgby_cultured_2]WDU83128.1 hypothetical protein PWK10_17470 [Caloramator sp. Dgby_cultured_2]
MRKNFKIIFTTALISSLLTTSIMGSIFYFGFYNKTNKNYTPYQPISTNYTLTTSQNITNTNTGLTIPQIVKRFPHLLWQLECP